MAGIYTALFLAALWIFPLFPAEPKLGPVYQPITHMVPLWFPVLLIVPAFALDVLRRLLGERWGRLWTGVLAGCVFLAAFVAAQWPFASFLISPAARNRFFGTTYFGYFDPANVTYDPYRFVQHGSSGFAHGMMIAAISAIIFSCVGMAIGSWLKTVKR